MATHHVWSGAAGAANGDSFTDAYVSLTACLAGETIAAGDTILVADDHAVNAGAAITLVFSEAAAGPVYVLCVNRGSGLLSTGAIEETGGNFVCQLNGLAYGYGMEFKVGTTGTQSSARIDISQAASTALKLSNCKFSIANSGSSSLINLGIASSASAVEHSIEFLNCTLSFGGVGQSIVLHTGAHEFVGCTLAGTAPTTLFTMATASYSFTLRASGCTFSTPTNLVNVAGNDVTARFFFNNCTVPANIVTGASTGVGGCEVECHACGSADHNYDYYYFGPCGTIEESVSVYLTTGHAKSVDNDGTEIPYSLKFTPSANASLGFPLVGPWVYAKNALTGARTVEMKAAHTESAVLKDNQLFIQIEYMGGGAVANSPQTERLTSAPVVSGTIHRDILAAGTNLTDNVGTDPWTGAMEKSHTLSKAVTIDEQGYLRCRMAVAKVTTNPVYLNNKISVA